MALHIRQLSSTFQDIKMRSCPPQKWSIGWIWNVNVHRDHLGISENADSDCVGLGWSLRVYNSNTLPGDVNASGPHLTHGVARCYRGSKDQRKLFSKLETWSLGLNIKYILKQFSFFSQNTIIFVFAKSFNLTGIGVRRKFLPTSVHISRLPGHICGCNWNVP